MHLKKILSLSFVALIFMSGCASVPMAASNIDTAKKAFKAPPANKSGLYVYRDSYLGAALKKNIYLDGKFIGESAAKTYFYRDIMPGIHTVSTESEFSNNDMKLNTVGGKNYFIRQYIKFGVFVGGAGLELKSEAEGKKGVLSTKLAK